MSLFPFIDSSYVLTAGGGEALDDPNLAKSSQNQALTFLRPICALRHETQQCGK